MPSTIWTRCAGAEQFRLLSLRALRMVEAQHRVATQKLVDSAAEQMLLEELLEQAKPHPLTTELAPDSLHYLLSTPFRYPPLRYGSRFGTRTERGIWYGALEVRTVLAEVAYYRFIFLDDTQAGLDDVATEHSMFAASIGTRRGIDLTAEPFANHTRDLASPLSYAKTQPLGAAMRAAGVQAFLFRSARDRGGGANVGVFDPSAFRRKQPVGDLQTWHCLATRNRVVFTRRHLLDERVIEFQRADFERSGSFARVE